MKSTKKKLVAGTGFITGKSPGRENEDEDSPAIAIGKMTDMELDKEFERMLDNMNLTEMKKEPLRRLPRGHQEINGDKLLQNKCSKGQNKTGLFSETHPLCLTNHHQFINSIVWICKIFLNQVGRYFHLVTRLFVELSNSFKVVGW